MDNIEVFRKEVLAWQKFRNNKNAKVDWQFTTKNAREKLLRIYPTHDDWRNTSLKAKQKLEV